MQSPFEAQALIQSDLIVSLGKTRRDAVLLLQQPMIDYGPPDQRAPSRANMGNSRKTRDFSRENVRQMRPRDAEIIGRSLDVHNLAIDHCLTCSAHRTILHFKVLVSSSSVSTSPGPTSVLRWRMIMCTTTGKSFQMKRTFIRKVEGRGSSIEWKGFSRPRSASSLIGPPFDQRLGFGNNGP